jgi:hypothetical protein
LNHAGIGRIAVDTARGRSIPINHFVICDIAVNSGRSGFECGNERLREI